MIKCLYKKFRNYFIALLFMGKKLKLIVKFSDFFPYKSDY